MTSSSTPSQHSRRGAWPTIWRAGVLAGAMDAVFVVVLYGSRGVDATRLFKGIAAGWVGREAAGRGGLAMAALGLASHFVVALGAAAVFYAASRRWRVLTERPVIAGLVYGGLVFVVMNLVVVPLSALPRGPFPPPLWGPVLVAHLLCVGLPIAWVVARTTRA